MKKKVLITGAAGFIGFHAALKAFQRGDFVIGLDNFNPYYAVSLKRAREAELKNFNIKIVEADICEQDRLQKIIEDYEITHILHLAAQAGVRYSLEKPESYIKSNIDGFLSLLETVRRFPKIPMVYASSSSVYGLNTKVPFSEEDMTDSPASLYGATKKANELMAASYAHLFQLKLTGLRFFTVYGPFGRPDMAYYSFSEKISKGLTIEVFNHGKMSRDMTYIDDIVEGILSALDLSPGGVFNLGNNSPVPLETMVCLIEKGLGKKAVRKYLPMQKGDVIATYADIARANKILGFSPKVSVEEGIEKFIEWYLNFFQTKRT